MGGVLSGDTVASDLSHRGSMAVYPGQRFLGAELEGPKVEGVGTPHPYKSVTSDHVTLEIAAGQRLGGPRWAIETLHISSRNTFYKTEPENIAWLRSYNL